MSGLFGDSGTMTNDPMGRMPATMPHLIQHLWDAYQVWLGEKIQERITAGTPTVPLEEALKRAPATSFAKFCADYLTEHRIAEIFQLESNLGVRLTNGMQLSILPGSTAGDGAMEESVSVAITPGITRHDHDSSSQARGI